MESVAYLGPPELAETATVEWAMDRLIQAREVAIDVETIKLSDRSLIGIGAAWSERESIYVMFRPDRSPMVEPFITILRDKPVHIFHNGSGFDLDVISWEIGLDAALDMCRGLADTSLMGQVQGVPTVNLAAMSKAYCMYRIDEIADILPQRRTMLDIPFADVANKCLHDCQATFRLYKQMGGHKWDDVSSSHVWTYDKNWYDGHDPTEPDTYTVTPQMKDCYWVDIKLVPMLLRMSRRGMKLRQDRVHSWYEKLGAERNFYANICLDNGFEPSKNQQVGYVLASRGNWLPFTKGKKQLQTDEDTIALLKDPMAQIVLEWRHRDKIIGTYLRPWLDQERAYTHFRQDLSTMRLASSGEGWKHLPQPHRNEQNIPPAIRDVFEADSGLWSYADYSQMELRIMAYLAKEDKMLEAFANNEDVHTNTQHALWPGSGKNKALRDKAKTFTLAGGLYMSSPRTLAIKTHLPEAVCAKHLAEWKELYPKVAEYQESQAAWGLHYGWVETVFGRRCRLPPLELGVPHIEKCASNYPDQGSGADIVKRGMLVTDEQGADTVLQVHDEILVDGVFEFDPKLAHIYPDWYLPLEVKTGVQDWVKT